LYQREITDGNLCSIRRNIISACSFHLLLVKQSPAVKEYKFQHWTLIICREGIQRDSIEHKVDDFLVQSGFSGALNTSTVIHHGKYFINKRLNILEYMRPQRIIIDISDLGWIDITTSLNDRNVIGQIDQMMCKRYSTSITIIDFVKTGNSSLEEVISIIKDKLKHFPLKNTAEKQLWKLSV